MSTVTVIRGTGKALDDLASLIANPNPERPFENAVGEAGRRVCDGWSRLDPWAISALTFGPLAGNRLIGLACDPYLSKNGFSQPTLEPPFTGGQCPVSYLANITYTVGGTFCNNQTFNLPSANAGVGPVGVNTVLNTQFSPSSNLCPGFSHNQLFFTNAGGQTLVSENASGVRLVSVSFRRSDGQADDCGDPPSIPEVGTNPAPSPGAWPSGEDPGIGPGGQPFFFVPDIETPFGPEPLPGDPFAPAPAFPVVPGSDNGQTGAEDAVGGVAGEVEGGEDGEEVAFGSPPEGRVWVGAVFEAETDNRVGGVPGTGPQNKVWPRVVGNCSLRHGNFFSTSVAIVSTYTLVVRAVPSLLVNGAFLQAQPGTTLTVRPISALQCPENICSEE